MTLLWSPSQPMAEAVPSAPVKASVSTLNAQRYAGLRAGSGRPKLADAAGPAPGQRSVLETERTAAAKRQRGRRRSPADLASLTHASLLYQTASVVTPASGPEDHLDGVGRVPVDGRPDGLPVVLQPELVRHDHRMRQQTRGEHVERPVHGVPVGGARQPG